MQRMKTEPRASSISYKIRQRPAMTRCMGGCTSHGTDRSPARSDRAAAAGALRAVDTVRMRLKRFRRSAARYDKIAAASFITGCIVRMDGGALPG